MIEIFILKLKLKQKYSLKINNIIHLQMIAETPFINLNTIPGLVDFLNDDITNFNYIT